jgi:hypothetical protein
MSNRGKDKSAPRQPPLGVLNGGRDVLERELLWLVALGGDKKRAEELSRILGPAANHALRLAETSSSRSESDLPTFKPILLEDAPVTSSGSWWSG